jgi:hypothetical protein
MMFQNCLQLHMEIDVSVVLTDKHAGTQIIYAVTYTLSQLVGCHTDASTTRSPAVGIFSKFSDILSAKNHLH